VPPVVKPRLSPDSGGFGSPFTSKDTTNLSTVVAAYFRPFTAWRAMPPRSIPSLPQRILTGHIPPATTSHTKPNSIESLGCCCPFKKGKASMWTNVK